MMEPNELVVGQTYFYYNSVREIEVVYKGEVDERYLFVSRSGDKFYLPSFAVQALITQERTMEETQ
jgi:hypothetical protein